MKKYDYRIGCPVLFGFGCVCTVLLYRKVTIEKDIEKGEDFRRIIIE